MNRLPLGLRARPQEPGHGILVRLGARNGYQSARRFARSLALDFPRVLTGAEAPRLACLAGLDPELVRHCSPTLILPGRQISLCGHVLEFGDWSTRARRYCPVCFQLDVQEAHHLSLRPEWYVSHRTFWDVRLISACPAHRVQLAGHCYCCGEALGWQATNILQCARCRANLLTAPCLPLADPVGEYISCRLDGQPGGNDVLDGLSLSRAARLCERLGQIEAVGAVHTLPRQSSDMVLRARTVGFGMTRELASSVRAALDATIRRGEERNGLHSAYGWIYGEWLANSDHSSDAVRPLLFDHAVRNGVISESERRLSNNPRKTITMTQAARLMGMGYKRARARAAEAGILPQGSRRSVAFTIDPQAVAKLKLAARATTSVRDAAKQLKTGKSQVADLLGADLLRRDADGGIFSASISRLLADIQKQCCVGSPPDGLLGMVCAARNAAVPLWRIVEAARAGTMPIWQNAGNGLSQFDVRLSDVVALRKASPALSVEAAARRIGVHHDCARALARCGIIADAGGCLTDEAIAKFEREFVVGSTMARELGLSPRGLHGWLLKAGIQPAFDLKTHRQAVYRRLDISLLGLLP